MVLEWHKQRGSDSKQQQAWRSMKAISSRLCAYSRALDFRVSLSESICGSFSATAKPL